MAAKVAPQPDLEQLLQTLARNIRDLRARANWSTRALAQECRLNRLTIQRIENCEFPGVSLATIEALAFGLKVSSGSLLGQRPVPRKPARNWAADVLSGNLISQRERQGLTQQALSEKSKVHRSVIAAIEAGTRNPSLSTLQKLAGALNTSVERLLAVPRAPQKTAIGEPAPRS